MEKAYRICFLGYRQLTVLAQKVIDELKLDDTDIYLRDCNVETLPGVVDDALAKGYEIFIAGSGNAAAFSRYSHAHLCEINTRDIDYLIAIKKALTIGQRPAIATYRFSRNLNISLLSELSGAQIGHIVYEDSAELYNAIRTSEYDVIIGASHSNEYAEELGLKSVLVYAGEDTIRRTIIRARNLAIELHKEQRYNEINRAIIRNSPLGIIVSDEMGRISVMNQLAQNYIGVPSTQARGRLLSEIASNLSPYAMMDGDLQQTESYKIFNGVRVRCIQSKLKVKDTGIGVLTTLHIDNRNQKRQSSVPGASTAARWKELVAFSSSMQEAIALGKKYAFSDLPLTIYGPQGVEKELLAECVHTGGPRAQQPLLSVNLSSISKNDAGRHLLGSDDKLSPHIGLLEMANNGTLILRNLENANPAVQDCIFDVVNRRQLIRVGGYDPIPVNIRFITLINTPFDRGKVRQDLLHKLCTLRFSHPAFNDRREDIPSLFNTAISRACERPFDLDNYGRAKETLCFYSWPGNMFELSAAADRLASQLTETSRITPHAVHLMMVYAIGEDRLLAEILRKYPGLGTDALPPEVNREGINLLKYFLGYNNTAVAEKLGMSRTSLWRITKE